MKTINVDEKQIELTDSHTFCVQEHFLNGNPWNPTPEAHFIVTVVRKCY